MKATACQEGRAVVKAFKFNGSSAISSCLPREHEPGVVVCTDYLNLLDQEFLLCDDVEEPPTGLSNREFIAWAKLQQHPDVVRMGELQVGEDLRDAVRFEIANEREDIDGFRAEQIQQLFLRVAKCEDARMQWCAQLLNELKDIRKHLGGQICDFIEGVTESEDVCTNLDFQHGFPMVGEMGVRRLATKRDSLKKPLLREEVLKSNKHENNMRVFYPFGRV